MRVVRRLLVVALIVSGIGSGNRNGREGVSVVRGWLQPDARTRDLQRDLIHTQVTTKGSTHTRTYKSFLPITNYNIYTPHFHA